MPVVIVNQVSYPAELFLLDGLRELAEIFGVVGSLGLIAVVLAYRTYQSYQSFQLKKADAKQELERRKAEMDQQQQKNDAEIRLIEAKTAAQLKIADQQTEANQTTVIADLSRGLMGLFTEFGTALKEMTKTLQAMQLKIDTTAGIAELAVAHYQATNLHHDNTAVHNSIVEPMLVNIHNKVANTETTVTSIESKVDELIKAQPATTLEIVLAELTSQLKHYLDSNKAMFTAATDAAQTEIDTIGKLVDETTGATDAPLSDREAIQALKASINAMKEPATPAPEPGKDGQSATLPAPPGDTAESVPLDSAGDGV